MRLDRYAYAFVNPLKYSGPTDHFNLFGIINNIRKELASVGNYISARRENALTETNNIIGLTRSEFIDKFHLALFTPGNSSGIQFDTDFLFDSFSQSWALLLLAVTGGYINDDSLYNFSISNLKSGSNESMFKLAIEGYSEFRDYSLVEQAITSIIDDIDLKHWAFAFDQLFYKSIEYAYCNKGEIVDFKSLIYLIWDDFYFIKIGEDLSYHYILENDKISTSLVDLQVRENCQIFLNENNIKLNKYSSLRHCQLLFIDATIDNWLTSKDLDKQELEYWKNRFPELSSKIINFTE